MSLYESAYDIDEEQSTYDGDEDEYIDEVKQFPRRCNYNDQTMIMGNKISLRTVDEEERFNSNVSMFIRVHPDNTYTIDCFIYSELKHILNNSAPVFLWEGGNFGTALEDFPVYLLPIKDPADQEIWFEGNYGLLSRYSAFLLYEPRQVKIGSSFSASARHASLEYVWKVRPISKIQFLKGGIVSSDASVLSNKLDFAPGNYPGYDVTVAMVDKGDIPNIVCIEAQVERNCMMTNIFRRSGSMDLSFANSIQNNEYAIRTVLLYGKEYFEDGSFLFTGKRNVALHSYNDEITCGTSILTTQPIPDTDNAFKITYTKDDQIVWRETIVVDGVVGGVGGVGYEEEEKRDSEPQYSHQEYSWEEENILMTKYFNEELDIIYENKRPNEKAKVFDDDDLSSEISPLVNVLVYDIVCTPEFKLPSSQDVPNLRKLILYIRKPEEEIRSRDIGIPYYPGLEYLSIFVTEAYDGSFFFTPPPIQDMQHTPLEIVSLRNVKIDQENDEGLPVGLNIERLFIYGIKSTIAKDPFNMNLNIEGDEDPSTLYGTYPNLKFLSLDTNIDIPDFPKLCTLYWTGDENNIPQHPNPNVKVEVGDPSVYKSKKSPICDDSED